MLGWVHNLPPTAPAPAPAKAPAKVPAPAARPSRIRARYDNAQTTQDNTKLWGLTDYLSAKAANSFSVRRVLRIRSRYEAANSSYLQGIVNTTTNDLVSTGPTLQVTTPDAAVNTRVEAAFAQWAAAVNLVEQLRTVTRAKRIDGEGFLVLANYSRINSPVQLYPRDVEADQVTTPNPGFTQRQWVDGLELDELGNPTAYHLLRQHPGDLFFENLNPLEYDRVAARFVLHWFRKDRPGQVRGVPEITPSLELFGEMRRYRRAVLGAAESAASIAAYVKSQAPADGITTEPTPYEALDIERDLLVTLPAGADIAQIDAKQPTTTYDSFMTRLLGEACRCLNIPLNVALGTSQDFNFSSARLDHLTYHAGLKIERQQCEATVLHPLLRAWLDEAIMIPGLLPDGLDIENLSYEWHWPGFPYMDPLVDAQADTERLTNRTRSYARHFAEQGLDWEEEFAQLAAEKARMEQLGLTPADVAPNPSPKGGRNVAQEAPVAQAA